MFNHRKESEAKLEEFRNTFKRMSKVLVDKVIPEMETRKFGFTQIEALAVGVISNINNVESANITKLKKCITKFQEIELLSTEALSADISRTESVKNRLTFAIASFE